MLWHFSVFINDGLCLHPNRSLVRNIGIDGSGQNCNTSNFFETNPMDEVLLKKMKPVENIRVYSLLKNYYNPSPKRRGVKGRIKTEVGKLLSPGLKKRIKERFQSDNYKQDDEYQRLQNWPRFLETTVEFSGKKIVIPDIASFNFIRGEIFDQQIYKFNAEVAQPYILDCGTNIGLSIIYFKQLFPHSKIIGFEPDDKIFKVLQHNVEAFELQDVELINKALWKEETVLKFYSEGADGGRVAKDFDTQNIIEVQTTRLRDYLNRKVDFLKIDIEGAEFEVLNDVKDLLCNVERIFVEYHSFIGKEQRLPEILAILKDGGFRYTIQQHGVVSSNPFVKIESQMGMDILLNISGYRQ